MIPTQAGDDEQIVDRLPAHEVPVLFVFRILAPSLAVWNRLLLAISGQK